MAAEKESYCQIDIMTSAIYRRKYQTRLQHMPCYILRQVQEWLQRRDRFHRSL